MAKLLESSRDGNVVLLRLNRPEARNALSPELMEELASELERLDPDPEVRCVVIAGSDKVFAAGADIKAMAERSFAEALRHPAAGFWRRLAAIKTPMIAAVSGYALGGGCELALACDMIVAAEDAKFGLPEVKRGLVAAGGGLLRLPQRVPFHLAMEWALTGELIPAARGHAVGLVNRLTPKGGALAEALTLARAIAANGPLAVAASKRIIVEALDWPAAERFDRQREINEPVRSSADAREGATAFKEKRTPRWQGR